MAKVIYYPSASQLWTPAVYLPDFWLKPVDASLSLSSNNVITANDFGGNGRSISAGTTAQRPLRVLNGLGDKPIIRFDGTNHILNNTSVGANGSTSIVILAVIRFITGGSTEDLPIGVSPANNKARLRSFYRAANGTTLGFAGWAVDVPTSTHTLDIGGEFNLLGVWNTQLASPSNVRMMKNATITTHSTPENLQTTLDGLSIGGALGSGGYQANIEVAEACIYYHLPSTDILNRLMGYLCWENGLQGKLPAGFIYKDAAPTL